MKIKYSKLHPNAKQPTYATDGSGCFDLYCASFSGSDDYEEHTKILNVDHPVSFGTGLVFEVPEGHVMLMFSRSGHGFNSNISLSNCVGVIDSDYRSEVRVKLRKDIDISKGTGFYTDNDCIGVGDRIAQAMIIPFPKISFEEVDIDTLPASKRNAGGFGSTGA